MRTTVSVRVDPTYPVHVGAGVLTEFPAAVSASRVALISDATVAPLYAVRLTAPLVAAGVTVHPYPVAPGEQSKSIDTYADLLGAMARDGFDRRGAVVALGGGVVGDLAGFVAASFMRGVTLFQVPTTLLAMVDASVGGKAALNLPEGKNLVGAFWQPTAVFADVTTLASLPRRVFRQGAVELFKHGLLADPALTQLLFDDAFAPAGDPELLSEAVVRSVRVKAAVVEADEREAGARAHLNLGHTLAHALEAVSDHRLAHGDAVAYGLHFAARLAAGRGWEDLSASTLDLLRWLEPDPLPAGVEFDALSAYLDRDKKSIGGRRRYVLLRAPGRPCVVDDVTAQEEQRAWRELTAVAR